MIETVLEDTRQGMNKKIEALKQELTKLRTGRASLSILDGIKVDYYGTPTPLNQVASLAVPESRLITLQPWDNTVIGAIEKAILKSELGLTPMNDGKIIRIAIPPLTEDRRKDLVKVVRKIVESYKVGIRNTRRESNEQLKDLKKEGDISEDGMFKAQEKVQKITDDYIETADKVGSKKEKEVLEF
ncbi:MAG: ribosome recycling factor [Desulfobacterales bacterium C00003106]|jgi:ribosome recycling factor|nr:ribosome recycling factor [Desulfobacterales bacterium]OEU53171.1 MAG: ribosome recycling factor [Desulfobacterales bacterium C00003106]OEU59116.1 MAG: ribosome recycling factor [Desulfobacterales bacterium C00003104]